MGNNRRGNAENIITPGLGVTTKIGCSNLCIYCPQDVLVRAYRKRSDVLEMSFDTFKRCLDKVPSNIPVYFAGMGEPWLNPECTRMVLYAYEKKHIIYVYTTLINMSLSDISQLKTCSYGCFTIHLPSEHGLDNINISEDYLKILEAMHKSNIKISYVSHSGMVSSLARSIITDDIRIIPLNTRAANLKNTKVLLPNRKKGIIGCERNADLFELLPNGDVVLCCMDYGLKHVLGNLVSEDYNSLFNSPEFLKVKKGLTDESVDILCRHCDGYAYNIDFSAKFFNHSLPRAVGNLKNIRSLRDILKFIKDCLSFLDDLIRSRY